MSAGTAATQPPRQDDFPIIVLGAGFAGIGMGIKLKRAGIESFTILERAADVGGTWRDNTYPGAACDVSSHLYSFSFEQNPDWSRAYGQQDEILQYIRHCTDKYDLRPHIRFGTEVVRAVYDEDSGWWRVTTRDGTVLSARMVISGCGPLSNPAYPNVPGLETFRGRMFHTGHWDHDYDLDGKRVAVIGSGASAIQVVPAIAPRVASLEVFQRTPPWVMPRPDRAMKTWEKKLYRYFPPALRLRRWRIYWTGELFAPLLISDRPVFKRMLRRLALKHIHAQIADPALRRRVIPDYEPGCKRVLISNDWYPALQRDNVELIDGGAEAVTPNGVRDSEGREHEVDAIIAATGFEVPSAGAPFEIRGRDGVDLDELWRDGAEAHKGVAVAGFPNFFFLVGPNTGPGHTSVLIYLEKQIDYVIQAIRLMRCRGLKAIEVRERAQERFNEDIQQRMEHTAWTSGCSSWYLAPNGKNTTLYPGFSWEYRLRVARFNPAEYRLVDEDRGPARPRRVNAEAAPATPASAA